MPEKSGRHKIIFALCFIALMLAFVSSSVIAYINNNFSLEQTQPTQAVVVDQTTEESKPNAIEYIRNFADKMSKSVDEYMSRNSKLSSFTGNLIKRANHLIGNDVIQNGEQPFVQLSNGYYAYIFAYSHPDNVWESTLDFSDWLEERSIDLLTVIPASKSDDSVTEFPVGVPCGYSKMEEEYRNFLDENSLSYLRAKDVLLSKNNNFYDWFYKTDHHWNVHAGRLVAEEIAKTLTNNYGLEADVDAVRESNLDLICYPKSFIGAMGYKDRATREDIELFYPKDELLFRVQSPEIELDKTGAFEDTLIDKTCLSEDSSYSAFLYGMNALIRIENKSCENNTRVLIISKSNANIVSPYLALSVRYLDKIDPRYYDDSILSFIEQTNPDIVITCVGVPEDSEEDAQFWHFD